MRARVAWAFALISAVCATADTVITAQGAPLFSAEVWAHHGWPLVSMATLGSSLMGALIVSRLPRHPVGWLLIVTGVAGISVASEAYSLWPPAGVGHDDVSVHVLGWVAALLGAPLAMTAAILIFLIAPDGHLMSPRWRWVGRAALAGFSTYGLGILTQSPTTFDVEQLHPATFRQVMATVGILTMVASLVAAAVGLVIRLRRATGDQRRQLLWIAAPAALLAAAFVWLLVATAIWADDGNTLSTATPLYAAYLSLPICTAVAVLRHRLFDIDVIVNRALVVFLATALVSGAYVLAVVVLGSAIGGDNGYWPSLLATALVALAFQPVRRQVVRVADRLAFGAAAEPYDALAEFTRRLGESPDPSDLLPAVAEAAANAVAARRVTVELTLPFAAVRTAAWPAGSAEWVVAPGLTTVLPVADDVEQLGSLTVEMPPGHPLRAGDSALLADLADQAVVAFRNARLSAELSYRVEELDHQARALEESRRRLISAGDAERSRLERAVTRDVARHLQELPAELDRLAEGTGKPLSAAVVQPLRARAEAALEALREITRGVYPAQLGRSGLEPALRSLLARTGGATLQVDAVDLLPRSAPRVEAAAYFCVAEAVRDLGGRVEVCLSRQGDALVVVIEGPDAGDLPLANMRDRAEALGGTISTRTHQGRQVLEVRLPAPVVGAGVSG